MAPISDRTFEVTNASRFRRQRLFLTGVEVTQAVQHFGSASHLTDEADRRPDNSLQLVSGKPACVRVYVAGRDVPPVTGTLEVWRRTSGFNWTSLANLAPEPPGEVTAVANPEYAHERGTLDATLNFIIPADLMCGALRLVARVSAGRWTDTLSVTLSVTLRQTLRMAAVMIAYDGPASKDPGAPNLKIAAPEIADLQAMTGRTLTHPGDGATFVAGQTLRLWGAATTSAGHPIDGERCCWTLNGKDVGRGIDIRVMAPAGGRHEATLTVHDESGTPGVTTATFVTVSVPGKEPTRPRPYTKRNPSRAAATSARSDDRPASSQTDHSTFRPSRTGTAAPPRARTAGAAHAPSISRRVELHHSSRRRPDHAVNYLPKGP